MFSFKRTVANVTPIKIIWEAKPDGFIFDNVSDSYWPLFEQLAEEEFAQLTASNSWIIPWASLYLLLHNDEYLGIQEQLNLPAFGNSKASLRAKGGFSDPEFNLQIHQWTVAESPREANWLRVGGLLSQGSERYLLDKANYALCESVDHFRVDASTRSYEDRLKDWSIIKVLASEAHASLDHFLKSSIVVTAEALNFEMHRAPGNQLIVEPTFSGVPKGWLQQFDARKEAHQKYDVSEGDNQTTVFLSPKVQEVLSAVKRHFVHRQIAGPKMDQFLRNPYSLLGESGVGVVSQEDFEASRVNAGIVFNSFRHRVTVNDKGWIKTVEILVDPVSSLESQIQHVMPLDRPKLSLFISELQNKLDSKLLCCVLDGHELELGSHAQAELVSLKTAQDVWESQESNFPIQDRFGDRVIDIGVREHKKLADAETLIREKGYVPNCGDELTGALGISISDKKEKVVIYRLSLKYKENIQDPDIPTEKAQNIGDNWDGPFLPSSLRADISLKQHQIDGLGWMQNRMLSKWSGCILADDMGLGKTLLSLSLMAWYLENDPCAKPCLVIAPVSLLENWAREVDNFFQEGFFNILPLHGNVTRSLKCASKLIDPALHERGVEVMLHPGWIGSANLVLTTYETLRDMEISIGMQEWGIVLCDEAQKIKNPTAIQSKAAKTLNANFRIACTGTPVENSLADLWSLFDFSLPGYLGSLRDFAKKYRKPIEVKTVGEKECLDELRRIIAPCILRRMKEQIAKDLPHKYLGIDADADSMKLPMSDQQLRDYADIAKDYRAKMKLIPPGQETFARLLLLKTLPHLRSICALGVKHDANIEGISLLDARKNSPKAAWVMDRLRVIQKLGEKAILFSEFRNVQRLIQGWVQEEFGIKAKIINGDVSVKSAAGEGRQDIIDQFQKAPGFGLLILGTKAVGFGVNIQAANHVIHYTRSWNPAQENQATDRAYRIGQTRNVYVYTPTVVHPSGDYLTFEQKLESLLARKRKLSEDILNGSEVGEEDLAELV